MNCINLIANCLSVFQQTLLKSMLLNMNLLFRPKKEFYIEFEFIDDG